MPYFADAKSVDIKKRSVWTAFFMNAEFEWQIVSIHKLSDKEIKINTEASMLPDIYIDHLQFTIYH